MNNKKLAKELVRLAKELTAEKDVRIEVNSYNLSDDSKVYDVSISQQQGYRTIQTVQIEAIDEKHANQLAQEIEKAIEKHSV